MNISEIKMNIPAPFWSLILSPSEHFVCIATRFRISTNRRQRRREITYLVQSIECDWSAEMDAALGPVFGTWVITHQFIISIRSFGNFFIILVKTKRESRWHATDDTSPGIRIFPPWQRSKPLIYKTGWIIRLISKVPSNLLNLSVSQNMRNL